MAKSDGPITEGIKNAIGASKMTPYAIAKAVTARGKVKLAPAQLYKFKSGAAGLTLAILDEIATVLGLVVHESQPIVSHEPTIEEPPAPANRGPNDYDLTTYEGRRAARRERRRQQEEDPARLAFRESVQTMKDSLAERRAARAAKPDPFADDEEINPTRKRPQPPLPRPVDHADDSWENYEPSSRNAERTRSMGSVNVRDMTQKIQIIATQITNPGMNALAMEYGGPGRSVTGVEKAKFFRFVSQMLTNNRHAVAIMTMPDLVDRFKDIAMFVPNPENVGRIADIVSQADLWPACEDPEKFKENLN